MPIFVPENWAMTTKTSQALNERSPRWPLDLQSSERRCCTSSGWELMRRGPLGSTKKNTPRLVRSKSTTRNFPKRLHLPFQNTNRMISSQNQFGRSSLLFGKLIPQQKHQPFLFDLRSMPRALAFCEVLKLGWAPPSVARDLVTNFSSWKSDFCPLFFCWGGLVT